MATEAYIPEFISITKGEGEEKNLTRVQLDATANENYPGELKNVEGALNDPPEIFEYSEKTKSMQVVNDIVIETESTVNKGNAGTSEGESFLESPLVSKVAHEETDRVSEDYQAGDIPNQAEKEIFREETKLQKYQKLEGAEEKGKVENEGMEEIKGEEKVAEELGETGFGGSKDKESEKSSILMGKEKDPEAEEIEHESDEGKKIPYDGTGDVTMTTAAATTDETVLKEAGITFKEKSQDTIVLSEEMKDVTPVEGEIQDQSKLDTPFVTQTEDLGLQKANKPEILKEVSEIGTEDINMKEIPDDKNLPQVDLNEKIDSEEAEILNKNSNELLVSYPSVEETVQVEGDKLDEISKFEAQQQVRETNGVSVDKQKHFEEATEAYKSTESFILETTSIEGEKASKTYAEAIDYGLGTEEESKENNAGQNIEDEIQKKEEVCDPEIYKGATKSNDTEKGIIDEDVSAKVSDTACIGNETIQKSFQVNYLNEVLLALTSEGNNNKAEDDVKDNITPEEVHDEIKITGATEGTRELIVEEDNVTEGLPESIQEETVKSFLDNEKVLLADEKSRGEDSKEQTIADSVKGTPGSIKEENFTDDEKQDENCKEEIFESSEMASAVECVESEKIPDTPMVKPKESLQGEDENQVPIEVSTEERRDEHRYSVVDEYNDDNTELVEVEYSSKEETSKGEENTEWISQKDETGEKLEQSMNVMSKVTEASNSSEYTEKITCIEEEQAIQDVEETFEKEETTDTKDSEERGTTSEEDLKPVAVASKMSKSTESTVLELKSEKGEIEVEKLEKENESGSEERFKGNDATEEEIKKEETYADLHKVETTCDDTEKSKIEEDALIKDGGTVWIGEETVELSCQEDEDGQNGTEKAALKLTGGDHSVRTDNDTENSTDQIICKEIAAISEGTEKHTIKEEHTAIDISPQSSGEETHKSSQEDETKEEGEKPIVKMCEEVETTTMGEGIEGQILEGNTIQDHSTVPTEVEETEDISKDNEMMAKTTKPEVSEISQRYDGVEDIKKDIFNIAVGEETNKGSTVEEKEEELDRDVCETIGACQDFEGSIKECVEVEKVAVELDTEAQHRGSEASDTKTNSDPTEENKNSVDPGEKLEGAPESVTEDQSNEILLELNQTQIKETSNNVQDQKSESVEEQNIEQGLQEDEQDTYEETESMLDGRDHINEIQNANETTCERTVDISHAMSEESEEINKEIIQEAETCYSKLNTAFEKVETEETSSWEAQLDEKPLKSSESSSEEKTLQTTAETSPQDEEGESMKPEETTDLMLQIPAIAGENAEKESGIVEKLHVDEVEETKGDSETVSESREQCAEDTDETQKSLVVEESEECIIRDEIKVSSKTVSGCNYEGVEAVIEDEINVVEAATAGKSEESHQQTSTTLLPEEQDHGITVAIGYSEDGIAKDDETPQNEDLEDSFVTKTEEEVCLQKEEPRELEISRLGLEVNKNMHKINPNEQPEEECITVDEVSQLEPQENVSAIKRSDSPTESDKVMELSEEVPEGAEEAAEESENIKELILKKEREIKEFPAVSIEEESVNKEQNSEIVSDENPRATNSEVQTEKVNLEVGEDFSKDPEGSPITKAMEEEILQKQGSEKKVDVSSSVSEISEEINKEVIEDADTCSNNIDTASEKVETEETSLQEAQLDDKHIKIIETSSEDKTLQTNIATETSPQGKEFDRVKLEETSEGVSQLPAIACENTNKESEMVERPHVDEVEEIKGSSETVSESREQCVEENDGTQKSLIEEESEEGKIKEEIKGPSEMVSGCNHEDVEAVIEDEIDVVQTATEGKSEEQHQETSKALLSGEWDIGIIATIGYSEDGMAKEGENPQNENLEDSFATRTAEEICLQKEEPREIEIPGLGPKLNKNIQQINPNEPPKEECITLDEVSQLEDQENVSATKCSDSPTESDKVMKLSEEVPERAQKAAEESENIKEQITEKEREIKEFPAVSIEDESVDKEQHSETVSDENPRATDSKVQTEKVNLEVEEDFSKDPEGSPIIKAVEEEMLQKQGTEKKVDFSSSVSEISEGTNKEVLEEAETSSNSLDIASEKAETDETNLQEAQLDDKHIKIIETSSEDKILQTNPTTETSPQGEEVDSIKLEETTEGVSQLPAIACENTDESETVEKPHADEVEEIKGPSDTVYECKEQCVEEIDETQKSLIVEESEESIIKEEIKGPSETVSGCNYEGVKAVIEDEIDVLQAATAGKSEESHQETSTALLSEEQDHGITAAIVYSEDGIAKEDETPQNEDLENSFVTKTEEEECLQQEEPRELEISRLGLEVNENMHKINPNEQPEEECITVDEVSQLEPQENMSATKCPDSPTGSDKVMEPSEEVPEGAEKAAEESENIKERIIESERDTKEFPKVSIEDESVNKGKHSETVSDENPKATDSKVQTEKVNLEVGEDFSKDPEGSPITRAMEEEILQKQGSEKKVDVSSSVSEISEEINKEVIEDADSEVQTEKVNLEVVEDFSKDPEGSPIITAMEEEILQKQGSEKKVDASRSVSEISEEIKEEVTKDRDTCSNSIDTASEKVETDETSLQEAQLDDKHIKIIETSSEDKTLQTNPTTETSPQGEEVDSIKLEENSEGVSQLPAIACENTDESETVEKPHADEVEEIKGPSDTVYKCKEQCAEEIDETQESLIVEESEECIIKEEIKGPSETVSGCNYEGVEAVIEDEINVVQAATAGKSEESHQETSTALLSEEQDHGITAAIGYSENGITKEDETPQNEDLEDPFATKTEEEVCLKKEEPKELEISGLGLEVNEDVQKNNPNELPKEECSTPDKVSQLEPQENGSEIKCTDSPLESDKVIELTRSIDSARQEASKDDENLDSRISNNRADDDLLPHLAGEDILQEVDENCNKTSNEESEKIEKASDVVFEVQTNVVEKAAVELEAGAYNHGSEASSLKNNDSLTEEAPKEAEKAAESENIEKLIIEKEGNIEEPAAVSIEDESANKVQHWDTAPSENLRAADANMQTEKVNLDVVEDFSQDPGGTPIEKALEEEMPQVQGSEKTVDVSSSISEISEETAKEVIEEADACYDKLDTASEKAETEETSLQETQLNDKHIQIIETSPEDKKLQTNTTIETSREGEEFDSVKLEETSMLVSQLPAIACENEEKESETVEKPTTDEVEETKGASDTESDCKEQWVEAIDETQKNPTVKESKEDIFTEEIKGPSETVSESKHQGVEAIIQEKITVVETATAGKLEKQQQETSAASLSKEQDHGISITIGCSEDGQTKEAETPQNENLEDSFATKTADYMHLQKEEPRELEPSGLGLELNENIQKNNPNEPPKEECSTIDEVSPLEAQENVSVIKCTDSPVESDKVMELTEEVLEGTEKAAERENIKELIIEKDRDIKELPAVSIDESVIKVQVLEPVSSANLGVTDPNMQTENLNLELEDSSKEPKGSPITEALEEEMSEKQDGEKAMDIPSSVSEMQEENIKKEIMEKADISYSKLETASEKWETEDSSLQEVQLDDKPLKIIETSSEDKTPQTNIITETSPQAEEVDSVKLEEMLELVSQLPANACENTNKESETVERPIADEIEETTGASDTVSESKEQYAEEINETQKSLSLEKSEEDIIKEQIKGASEVESESKYQGVEAIIEEEITAGQAINTEKPEEQLEEVSIAILSEEQEHGINTITGKLEDENIKEGETPQYANPEDSFGTKTSENICLQKEEPRELDVSGLGLEINEDAPKEDGNSVEGVSQYELQENASELKCTDSPLGSKKVMEQTRSINSTQQEATNDDENLDSGINPDVLTHSPGEEILQEVGENCEEASNLECENFEKASEPVSDLQNTEIDEAVVGLEVGAHIHGSDAPNTKNSENLAEEGAEKAVESENIKEPVIEKERDIKELPAVSIEDEIVNKVQHAEAVSNENLRAIDSYMQTERLNPEVAEYLSKDPEGSLISEALQEEISQKQASEKTVELTIAESGMSEESFKDKTIKEADTCCSKLDTAPEKTVTEEMSLQEVQLDDKPLKGIETNAAEKILSTNTTTESSLQGEEVDSMKVEETSELMSQLPTIACKSADNNSKIVENPHADEVEEPKGPDMVSESREQCVEKFVETQESLTLEKSEENIIKEEMKGPSDTVSECTYQSFEAVMEDEITADQTIESEKPEEQLQEMSTALVSEEQEHGISTITTKLEDENTVEDGTPQYENQEDSLGTKMTEERCLHKEESRELEVSELELNDDAQMKPSNEEAKEGGNFPYGITPSEPQEDAFEIKCTDSLSESDMEQTRSMGSTLEEPSKDDEDLDSGISIKNVDDVVPPHSFGEEILQKVDENCEEASNLEDKKIGKASESMSQVHSEVDKAEIDLEAGSHSHGSEASSTENNTNLTEKNIELADLGEKHGGGPELVAEDQCNETPPKTNQTQVNEKGSSAWEQNTKSIEEQIIGQGFQEHEKETIEETESKLESRDHINVIQNENETTKDVISVEEVPEGAKKAEEKELPAVSIEDETVNKVQHSEPVSHESFRATESNQEIKEVNLEDEEDPCEKPADVSSSVFELSEQGGRGKIIDEADNYNKLDTASEKVEVEKTILQEPQPDDEPLKGMETVLEEKTLPIINTIETSPDDEEAEVVKLEKISDLVSQLPTAAYEHADKESVIVEKPQADEVKETKIASDTVSESKDHCVEEIDETQRTLTMKKLEEDVIEEEITGRSRTVSACNQGVEAIIQDEITRESLRAGNSEEQLQEMSTAQLSEEKEHEITTTIGKSEAENKSENETPQKESLEDSLGTESVKEICLQKEGLRELEVSALAPKLSNVIQKESPNEALKEKGEPQEDVSEIKYMDSITGSEEVMKLTRSIDSSSQEASKEEEILDSGNSNNKADDFSITHSSAENFQQMQEQCEKSTNLESEKIEKAAESVSEVHYPEVFIKLEKLEVKEEHLKTSVIEMREEEIPNEKTIEANEILKNEISNEEIAEEKQVAEDYQPRSPDEETIRKSQQENELKNEVEHEELYGESQKGEMSEIIEKQIIDEARAVEHPHLVSFRDESVKDNLPEEAKGERNDKETDIKLDLANQSDKTALSEQADCSDIQLVRKDLDIADTNDNKEIVITRDEDLKPNLDVLPATNAAAEEASLQKEGDRIGEVSESVPQEPVHEITRRNEEIATAITDNSENVMEDKMHIHTPLQLACNELSEGLSLKDPEVNTNENGTSPLSEMSWEEIPDKEGVISEEERQHDLTSGKQTIAESMPTEEKGAKDEVKHAKDKEKYTKDEEPVEFSAMASEGKLEEAEMHSTKCDKDGEIQDQIEKLNASSLVQYSCMEISEKEVSMDLAEANESTQDIKQLEKGSDETSEKHIPREAEPNESTEVMISSSKEDVQLVLQDPLRKTFQQPEVESLEAVNVSGIESGMREKDSGGEKTMGDISEETAADSTPMGPAVSLSDLLQRSVKETLQAPGCLTEEKELMANKEDMLAKQEEEAIKVQEAGTHEDRDEEEEGDEHKKDDSGSDAPVVVEASRDINVKDGHKKSHNILSGVGSKVKHSIAKVKKAITGKSSHQKHSSPKGTATKVKEQK